MLLEISQYWRRLARVAHIGMYDSQTAQTNQINAGLHPTCSKRALEMRQKRAPPGMLNGCSMDTPYQRLPKGAFY